VSTIEMKQRQYSESLYRGKPKSRSGRQLRHCEVGWGVAGCEISVRSKANLFRRGGCGELAHSWRSLQNHELRCQGGKTDDSTHRVVEDGMKERRCLVIDETWSVGEKRSRSQNPHSIDRAIMSLNTLEVKQRLEKGGRKVNVRNPEARWYENANS
jgi:hypothetical protein